MSERATGPPYDAPPPPPALVRDDTGGTMDGRRLNTADAIAGGILNLPRDRRIDDIPQDRERFDGTDPADCFTYAGDAAVADALEAGRLVEARNYYGIPSLWKEADGVYVGILAQYRRVTEDRTFATATEAAEWFGKAYGATYG